MTFGTLNGAAVPLIALRGADGITAHVTPYGARLVALLVPDGRGGMVDVVLGHDSLQPYLDYQTYFGATCGRYANRIAASRFVLDGAEIVLDANEGPNHLHGGRRGLDKALWQIVAQGADHVTFATTSPAGDMGYPGQLSVTATYRIAAPDRLSIAMTAQTDAPTLCNLVNHAYFNLAGGGGDVLDHVLEIPADFYTPVTPDLLTTGEVRPVAGTGFDFRTPRSLRAAMQADPAVSGGWDHNWCLRGPAAGQDLHLSARLSNPANGLWMELESNQPGVQVYSCGMMHPPVPGKGGQSHGRFAGLTFETQLFPCAPNHLHFPQARLDPGQTYRHRMALRFGTA